MNKLLQFALISGTMMLTAISASAQDATTFALDGVEYKTIGENTVEVSDLDDATGKAATITIPQTVENAGKTYTVTAVGEYAFYYSEATKITLPETVTAIKRCGIYNCDNLTDLTIPAGLKTLEPFSLAYLKSIKSITIPEGVTEIPMNCFMGNTTMTSVTLPAGIKYIGNGAFYKTPLTEFTFPAACEEVGDNIFQNCLNLKKVVFNSALKKTGTGVFLTCKALTDVNLEAATQLEALNSDMFVECQALSDVTIPASVKTIGNATFGDTNISAFKIAEGNKNLVLVDGAIYNADKTLLYAYPSKGAETLTVDPACVGISGGAFYGSQIKKVTLPEGMLAFDDYAFCKSQLSEINFPKSLTYMGEQALAGTKFVDLTLPENLTTISDGLVGQSSTLKNLTIPANVRIVYNHAFQGCKALATVRCLGGVAPELYSYYDEDDNPFGYVSRESVKFSVPAGSLQSYKDAGWGDLFTINETEAAVFVPTSTTPATGSTASTFGTVEITFPEAATVVVSNPEVTLRKGAELYGNFIEPDNGWIAVNNSSDKKTVTVFGSDYDGFTQSFELEKDVHYFLTIPAGVVKNAAGALNQNIVLELVGSSTSGVESVSGNEAFVVNRNGAFDVVLGSLTDCTVEMYNAAGMKVAEANHAEGTVHFAADNRGLYIIRVAAEGKTLTFKVVK